MEKEEDIVELRMSQGEFDHLKELLSPLVQAEIEQHIVGQPPASWEVARELLVRRRQRRSFFPAAMFGEAAWEIMLTLYSTSEAAFGISAKRLADKLGLHLSLCLRWLTYLEQEQLVCLKGHADDAGSKLIVLTAQGKDRMARYLERSHS